MSKSYTEKLSIEGYYDLTEEGEFENSSPKNLLESVEIVHKGSEEKTETKPKKEITSIIDLLEEDIYSVGGSDIIQNNTLSSSKVSISSIISRMNTQFSTIQYLN